MDKFAKQNDPKHGYARPEECVMRAVQCKYGGYIAVIEYVFSVCAHRQYP
jgi:hypothetical protein